MRWLSLVHLPPRRLCLQAGFQVAAGSQAAGFQVVADFPAGVGFHPAADSTARRYPEVGSAVEAVVPGRAPLIFPGQDPAPREAWLRMASLRAAVPNRAPRIFPGQGLAGQEA
jgi:hypothetical protein